MPSLHAVDTSAQAAFGLPFQESCCVAHLHRIFGTCGSSRVRASARSRWPPARWGSRSLGLALGPETAAWSLTAGSLPIGLAVAGGAAFAVGLMRHMQRPRSPSGAREVSMAIVPWGVIVDPGAEARILRWSAIRKIDVEIKHTLRGGTPAIVSSVVTVQTEHDVLAGHAVAVASGMAWATGVVSQADWNDQVRAKGRGQRAKGRPKRRGQRVLCPLPSPLPLPSALCPLPFHTTVAVSSADANPFLTSPAGHRRNGGAGSVVADTDHRPDAAAAPTTRLRHLQAAH